MKKPIKTIVAEFITTLEIQTSNRRKKTIKLFSNCAILALFWSVLCQEVINYQLFSNLKQYEFYFLDQIHNIQRLIKCLLEEFFFAFVVCFDLKTKHLKK